MTPLLPMLPLPETLFHSNMYKSNAPPVTARSIILFNDPKGASSPSIRDLNSRISKSWTRCGQSLAHRGEQAGGMYRLSSLCTSTAGYSLARRSEKTGRVAGTYEEPHARTEAGGSDAVDRRDVRFEASHCACLRVSWVPNG